MVPHFLSIFHSSQIYTLRKWQTESFPVEAIPPYLWLESNPIRVLNIQIIFNLTKWDLIEVKEIWFLRILRLSTEFLKGWHLRRVTWLRVTDLSSSWNMEWQLRDPESYKKYVPQTYKHHNKLTAFDSPYLLHYT